MNIIISFIVMIAVILIGVFTEILKDSIGDLEGLPLYLLGYALFYLTYIAF